MAAPQNSASGHGRNRKPLVYLVDDDPLLLDLLEVSLHADGYQLKKFLDAEEALKSFLSDRPHPVLLVTDYALGKMNGLDLIEQCKAANPHLKIVMVSGTASAEIALRSPVKVDRFLGKPYQPTTLSQLVRGVLDEDADGSA